jgi:hypothetical protein
VNMMEQIADALVEHCMKNLAAAPTAVSLSRHGCAMLRQELRQMRGDADKISEHDDIMLCVASHDIKIYQHDDDVLVKVLTDWYVM